MYDSQWSGEVGQPVVVVPPTVAGWSPRDLVRDVLDLRESAIKAGNFGPHVLCLATSWRPYLKGPYAAPRKCTLRERLLEIDGILGTAFCDGLKHWQVHLAQVVVYGGA